MSILDRTPNFARLSPDSSSTACLRTRSSRLITWAGEDTAGCSASARLTRCSAAWLRRRVILSQVSPEAGDIFDGHLTLHRACNGEWKSVQKLVSLSHAKMYALLSYGLVCLSNVGNYYVYLSNTDLACRCILNVSLGSRRPEVRAQN